MRSYRPITPLLPPKFVTFLIFGGAGEKKAQKFQRVCFGSTWVNQKMGNYKILIIIYFILCFLVDLGSTLGQLWVNLGQPWLTLVDPS